jgi:two-component system phosphate regulon response regulator PhoB
MSSYILIVENEEDIADVMRRYLEFEGYTITCVTNCEAGRAACAVEQPNLIVLDWHLPDMEGNEWLMELRADHTTADIPIIMMTGGYPTPALTIQLRAAQIPLLIKPFSLGQLVESIQQMTAREHALGAAGD